jgi:ATP-dependent protease ClpP protease subunit
MAPPKKAKTLIESLEAERNSTVISYITSQRQPGNLFATKIALDVIPILYRHLRSFGKVDRISLFLNSTGGDLQAPWPIVNLIREFCSTFEVIIPYRAQSAATLICLGANKIIMSELSQLSPVDPEGLFKRGANEYRIEVEDVLGFIDFAKERIGLNEQASLSEALKVLSEEIPPTILGSVNRTLSLIRKLSENLLKLHIKDINKQPQIDEIVSNLTQKLFSHSYVIGRREAKDLIGFGRIVEYAEKNTREISDDLLDVYFDCMKEKEDFNPETLLGEKEEVAFSANKAIIDSRNLSHIFEGAYVINKEGENINIGPQGNKWVEYKRGGGKK